MFAELSPVPAEFLKNTLLVIGGGLGLVSLARGVFWGNRREITPQPLQVTPAPKYVTHEECQGTHASIRERVARVEALVDQIRTEAKNDRDGIVKQLHEMELRIISDGDRRDRNTHARINDLSASVSKVVGHLENQHPAPA